MGGGIERRRRFIRDRGDAMTSTGTTELHWRAGAALLLIPALAVGCGDGGESGSELVLNESAVVRGTLESSVEATGTVEPIRLVEVRSQASGEILRMPVDLGDPVERGDLLLEIDPRDEVNELNQAQADLEQAEAQLQVSESRLERVRSLRDSGVVTDEELESAIVEHANARSSFVRAETRVELARERRNDATVRAPISGTVVQKGVEQGQVVTGTRDLTGGTVLLQLADLSNVQVRTMVDESEIGGVKPGQPAEITVEAFPNRTFTGEVLQVEPQATVEQNVTMFAVLTRIPNEEGLLKPGMNADVSIEMGRREGVLKVANGGVKTQGEARQLVDALGMDPALLERRPPPPDDGAWTGEGEGPPPGGAGAADGNRPSPDQLASMSREERRERLESMSPDERRRMMRDTGGGPGARNRSADSGTPTPGFVFTRTEDGGLTLRPVLLGLSSWEETEIVSGLEEGDTVVNVPLAMIQQNQMLEQVRGRMSGPGF